ncbi:MAG: substrate-binding domain-containing protein [Verrucomicrobia bacterium]|nr:substrate-binding domain-containing protein [Verrucomicrobiota bacterium]
MTTTPYLHRILRLTGTTAVLATALCLSGCGRGEGKDEIIRVSRQSSSGTYEFFREHVLNKKDFKLGSRDMNGSKEVVELIANTPGAIGYSGMGYHEPGRVKMLPVALKAGAPPVEPTVVNTLNKSYPIARSLLIYTLGEPEGEVKRYIDWTLSDAGQKIVETSGYVPLQPNEHRKFDAPAASTGPKVTLQVKGSDTMVNVAQAWAEAYKKVAPHVDVEVSGGGSGQGIAALIKGTIHICNASRNMKAGEIEQAKKNTGKTPKEIVVGYDALAIYVHKDNPIQSITLEQLAGIFAEDGTLTKWSQLAAPAP